MRKSGISGFMALLLVWSLFAVMGPVEGYAAVADYNRELLPNGGMETITDGKPAEWVKVGADGFIASVTDNTYVRSGSASVKLEDASTTKSTALRSARVPATPGATYVGSVYAYDTTGSSQLYMEFWNSANQRIGVQAVWNTAAGRWNQIKITKEAPAGTAYATLLLYQCDSCVAVSYYDDASVREAPPANDLNGDFETVVDGVPANWSKTDQGTQQSVTDVVYSGVYSVKLQDPSASSGNGYRSIRLPVQAGETYRTAAYSLNQSGSSDLYLEFWNSSGSRIGVKTLTNNSSNVWVPLEIVMKAPAGASYATVLLYQNNGNVGTSYFDAVIFNKVLPVPPINLNNGGFESSVQNKPLNWTEKDGNVSISTEQVKEGGKSAKLTASGGVTDPSLASDPVRVMPGERYNVTVETYALQGTPKVQLEFYNDNAVLLSAASFDGEEAANNWSRLSANGIAPTGAYYAAVRLGMKPGQAGTAFFDDARIRLSADTASFKARSSYFTPEKVAAARENVNTYTWAADTRNNAVAKADKYLDKGLDYLWKAIPGPELPRSYGVNQVLGSPITGREIDKYGNYPYKLDPLNDPWKIVDPSSGYKFPTNDFGAYYRSGLDEHGIFQPSLADRSLLVNTLYPEKGPSWGVDDGFGWVDEKGNRYTFVAYYNHWAQWYLDGIIGASIVSLRDAYLYTGDPKYARAGTVVLDRVADVYPDMDTMKHDKTIYLNSHGGSGLGKIVGSIWETILIKEFISAYDAFFPAMDDPGLIQFLSEKAQEYRLTNGKETAAEIRRNIEDGLIRQIFPAVKAGQISGNKGTHESTLALAARVFDTLPETKTWLDYMLASDGGRVFNTLTDVVDRDGQGDEGAPGYSGGWLDSYRLIADILDGYDLYPDADLYQNAKFRKMFNANIPLILSEKYYANIGDTGKTGDPGLPSHVFSKTAMLKAFEKFGDPIYAQMAYFLNNNSADGLHLDVFSEQPNDIANLIRGVIANEGPLDLKSDNLAGQGLAVLRDGVSLPDVFGVSYAFPSMEIVIQTVPAKLFQDSGTMQLEANQAGEAIVYQFTVPESGDYEIDMLPFRASSYGIYRISIDGNPIKEMDFSGVNTNQVEVIGSLELSAGLHRIGFEGIGKAASSSNYKMGVRKLLLLDEAAREMRDQAGPRNTLRDFWMHYGRTSSHGHADTLQIGVHAFGLDLSPDLGYPEFADTVDMHRAQWVVNTVSHNTVVVDKSKQNPQWVAEPKHFDDTDRVKLMDVEAPKVYPQTQQYKRTTAMIKIDDANSYGIDFFRVLGGGDHVFSFHGAEGTVTTEGLAMVPQATGTYAGPDVDYAKCVDSVCNYNYKGSGFHYLKDVSRDNNPADQFSVDWKVADTWKVLTQPADIHLRLTMLGPVDDVALANGVPPQNKPGNPQTVPYLLAHRSGTNLESLFTSVIEPYKDNRTISSIQPAVVKREGQAADGNEVKAVKIALANGRIDYIVYAQRTDVEYVIDDKLKFKGFMGVYSEKDGKPEYSYVHDGAYIAEIGNTVEAFAGALTGMVAGFTKEPSVRNDIVVEMDMNGVSPDELAGASIYVANDGVRNGAYRILGVAALGGNRYKLDIGDITLIRGYKNPADFTQGYRYDIAENAAFRIPLTRQISPITTTAQVSGEQQNGWFTGEATVTLSVYGSGSGKFSTAYRLNEGAAWIPYTNPFVIGDSGIYEVQYRSAETSGYEEPIRSLPVNIDRDPPVSSLLAEGTKGTDGVYTSDVSVTLHATDALSGVAGTEYSLVSAGKPAEWKVYDGPIILDMSGTYTLLYRSTDKAGHTETEKQLSIRIDTPAKGAPGKPVLSDNNGHDTGLLDGSYSIKMDMWWGDNGRTYKLYENDILIDTQQLTDRSPSAQSAVTSVTYRNNGTYRYYAELVNAYGTTRSDVHIVEVTQASPGAPVLSHDNYDSDGSFNVKMNLWWGTNGTTYRLYENGIVVDTQQLADATPGAQHTFTSFSGKQPGMYSYRCELENAAGSTSSEVITVEVR